MSKIFKPFSKNKKTLFLLIGLGLVLSLMPFQFIEADNKAPVAKNQNITTDINKSAAITLTATDADGDTLTYSTTSNPSHGTLTGTPPNLTYTPKKDFAGTDNFKFKANDGTVDSNEATVNINVKAEWCPGSGINPVMWLKCIVFYAGSIPIRLAFFLPALFLILLTLSTGMIYALIVGVVNWLTKITMVIPITPSNPAMAPEFIVNQAFQFTRSLANMFFILILVFIGLATILKLKEYETKKLLPLLIIIVLLINFSPVIVGFIIDVTNIFTNFFLKAAGTVQSSLGVLQSFSNYFNSTLQIWTSDGAFFERLLGVYEGAGGYLAQFIGIIVYGVVLSAFYIFGVAVYLIVGVLFFCRILYLWILMILAPIAFLFYIFPATKKLYFVGWDNWWENLIKWSIIGIPIGFFLWLSNWVMAKTNTGTLNAMGFDTTILQSQISGGQGLIEGFIGYLGTGFATLFVNLLVPIIALVLLYYGTELSKKLAPEAAIKIVEGVKKVGKVVATSAIAAATLGVGAAGMAGLIGKGGAGFRTVAQGLETGMGRVPIFGKALKYGVGKPISRATSWATRGLEMVAAPPLEKYAAKVRKVDIGKEMKERGIEDDIEGQINYIKSLPTEARKIQGYAWMAKQGNLQKSPQEWQGAIGLAEKFVNDPHFKKEVGTIMNALPDEVTKKMKIDFELAGIPEAEKTARKQEIKNKINDIVQEFGLTGDEAEDQAAAILHIRGFDPSDVSKVAKKSLKSVPFQLAMQKMSSAHLQVLENNFDEETVNAVLDEGRGLNTLSDAEVQGMETKNRKLFDWAHVSPAGKKMLNWSKRPTPGPTAGPTPTTGGAAPGSGASSTMGPGRAGRGRQTTRRGRQAALGQFTTPSGEPLPPSPTTPLSEEKRPPKMTEADFKQKIREEVEENYRKRWTEVKDKILKEKGITSGTPEAEAFFESGEFRVSWREEIEKEVGKKMEEKKKKEGYAGYTGGTGP